MADFELIRSLSRSTPSKIVMLVIDGLGGLPHPDTGKTELETASTPNLDALASRSICGLSEPVGPGITPGSGPGHLALFGYDPVACLIGRGVLEATGVDFDLKPGDVAARGNFCTVDDMGRIVDRRAGRIVTEKSATLTRLLDGAVIDGVRVIVQPVKDHRFIAVFRGDNISPDVTDSDPEQEGVPPKPIEALTPQAERMAAIANKFAGHARKVLADKHPANMVLLRGFSVRPDFPSMTEIYNLKPAAIATYPMYRGLARLVGMDVLKTGASLDEELATLHQSYVKYDFFFIHVKATDAAGEDGDFARKVKVLEEVDRAMPALLELKPDVVVVTGDHSTPARLEGHSWHPVPLLIFSAYCRPDSVQAFSESDCATGALGGRFPATEIMPLAMANALKLTKFGA